MVKGVRAMFKSNPTHIKKESPMRAVFKRLRKNKVAMFGFGILVLLILMAVFAPWIAPYNYAEMDLTAMHQGPSMQHLFGTDNLGRDIFSRIIYGSRYSLSLGIAAVLFSTAIGVVIGSIAGYFGGAADTIIMRILDVIQSIPGMLLAIIISAVLGAGFENTILAMSIGGVPMTVRLLRAQILSIRKQEYLEAATAINCPEHLIISRYVLPNSYAPLLVSATMGIGNTIMAAAALSYIGLGIQPPLAEWGAMLSAARGFLRDYPHELIFPGIFIMITVLALNLLGDGLRDALDPKLKK